MICQSIKVLTIGAFILTLTSCGWMSGKQSPPREPLSTGIVYENDIEKGTQDKGNDDNGGAVDTETIEE